MQNLTFEFPAWFLILCAAAGLVVALILYYRERNVKEQPRSLVWGMGFLRWLGYSLLASLLLSPLLKDLQKDQQEPTVVLAHALSAPVSQQPQRRAVSPNLKRERVGRTPCDAQRLGGRDARGQPATRPA